MGHFARHGICHHDAILVDGAGLVAGHMRYREVVEVAARSARSDSETFRRRLQFRPMGYEISYTSNENGN